MILLQAASMKHRFSLSLAFLLAGVVAARAAAPDAAGLEFFEKHVRPVLVENCYKCHSAETEKGVKGGLRLDTKELLLKGGDTGPAIVPGVPEKSLLIKAIQYGNEDLQMPPKGKKLPPDVIDHLVAWVRMGAPDPRSGKVQSSKSKVQSSKHWAFQPVQEPVIPVVKNKKQVQSPIDALLLAKLEAQGLSLSPRADRRTLIRRATFDLTGLPPTAEEVAAFERDNSAEAFARVIDRLLASPRYGERWGRYWLDVARYADTKGYVFEEERRYPYSYTYRDWVIRALNEDLPYDQFLVQQIAADQLPLGDDKRALAALGFLTLGRRFLNNQPDIIDDRIDVVARGTMGLTVACARCHDHKFDPIPTKDYYSLYGVFSSSHEPGDEPLLGTNSLPNAYPEYVREKKKREQELEDYREEKEEEIRQRLRGQVGDYLLVIHDADAVAEDKREAFIRERKLQPPAVKHFKRALKEWEKSAPEIFGPWIAFTEFPATNFASKAKEFCAALPQGKFDGKPANAGVVKLFPATNSPATLKEAAERFTKLFIEVDEEWRAAKTNTPAPAKLAAPERESLRAVLHGPTSPIAALDGGELRGLTDTPVQQKLRALKRKIDELDATHDGAPPRAMALLDNDSPSQPVVFKRGNPNLPGDKVPRQFLEVIAGPDRKPFSKGSGRLEMAQAIANRENPLTARVFVNRVWMYHFVTPLVRTPSDFGTRSDPPTQPELLDYLASRFMAGGWSIKKLHKLLMLSSAYQQSSADNPKAEKIDPANQNYWRMNRRRLDFESLRDTLLASSGKLDLTVGGRAVDITGEQSTTRRTVYSFVERQNLPGIFRTFDFASPDATSPQRFSTTVPQQALFLMNSPFVVQQAQAMLQRADLKSLSEDGKVRRLYQVLFQREPESDELKVAQEFLSRQIAEDAPPEPPSWSYGYGHFDEQTKRVSSFAALPHWAGYAWQGGTNLPDAKLGWVVLTADGGHVGNDLNHAVIRRWRAPRDGVVKVRGELNHPSNQGDGVRGRAVSSRTGLLAEWTARDSKTNTALEKVAVKRGDFIDFVTDCRQSVEFDSFHWSPVVRYEGKPTKASEETTEWNAQTDFSGPTKPVEKRALNPWEKYAQVLLLANELVFVD